MNKLKSQQGLTLVEVLAALVILGIVFVGIMTVFPQMTLFNNKTEAKLDTMNLARQEMANIVSPVSPHEWIGERDEIIYPIVGYQIFEEKIPEVMPLLTTDVSSIPYTVDLNIPVGADFVRYTKVDGYTYEVDISLECEPYKASIDTGILPCDDPLLPQLFKVHLKIYDENQLSSETYSYIKFTVEKLGG